MLCPCLLRRIRIVLKIRRVSTSHRANRSSVIAGDDLFSTLQHAGINPPYSRPTRFNHHEELTDDTP